MFFARSASLRLTPTLATAPTVSEVSLTGCTWKSARLPSSTGLTAYPTLARFRLVNSSVSTMIVPPRGRSGRFALRATGFTAETAAFGNSLSTVPDFPAEIRAPAGTLPGVSAFQLHFADHAWSPPATRRRCWSR